MTSRVWKVSSAIELCSGCTAMPLPGWSVARALPAKARDRAAASSGRAQREWKGVVILGGSFRGGLEKEKARCAASHGRLAAQGRLIGRGGGGSGQGGGCGRRRRRAGRRWRAAQGPGQQP